MAFKRTFTPVLDGAAVAIGDGTVRTQTVKVASGEYTPPIWLRTEAGIVVPVGSLPFQGVLRAGSLSVHSTDPSFPNPLLLPDADGELPDYTAYDALNVPALAVGGTYIDPGSGQVVHRITGPGTHGGASCGGDYTDGGNRTSRRWGDNWVTMMYLVHGGADDGRWLVDYQLGTGTLANRRQLTGSLAPATDLCFSFSNNPLTPRIAYVCNGGDLKRIDTEAMALAPTGLFPQTTGTWAHWMMHDKNDEWFTCLDDTNNGDAIAWNSQTGALISRPSASITGGINEVRIDRDGGFAILTDTTDRIRGWNLGTDTLGTEQSTVNAQYGHVSSHRGGMWSNINNSGSTQKARRHVLNPSTLAISSEDIVTVSGTSHGNPSSMHFSGNWVQDDAELGGDLEEQWVVGHGSWIGSGVNPAWPASLDWRGAILMYRLSGTPKLVCHNYTIANSPNGYWPLAFPDIGIGGDVITFSSTMNKNGSSNRFDRFLVEMPR